MENKKNRVKKKSFRSRVGRMRQEEDLSSTAPHLSKGEWRKEVEVGGEGMKKPVGNKQTH